jgi:hypothetical protein
VGLLIPGSQVRVLPEALRTAGQGTWDAPARPKLLGGPRSPQAITTVDTSNALEVSASSANGSALVCLVAVSEDKHQAVDQPAPHEAGPRRNASNVPVPGGDCTPTVKVHNTGDTAIRVPAGGRR